MSTEKKYNPETIMALLKLMLSVRQDLSKEEKDSVIKLAEEMMFKKIKYEYEDKQEPSIKDYKRRN